MRLIVHELSTSDVKQKIKATENLNISAIRPHLYKHMSPSGSLKIELLDNNSIKIDESESINISSISSANYFHGYVRFYANFALRKNEEYYLRLGQSGYIFSEANYVGWCNDFDLRKITATYARNTGYHAALDVEIWDNKLRSWRDI